MNSSFAKLTLIKRVKISIQNRFFLVEGLAINKFNFRLTNVQE